MGKGEGNGKGKDVGKGRSRVNTKRVHLGQLRGRRNWVRIKVRTTRLDRRIGLFLRMR